MRFKAARAQRFSQMIRIVCNNADAAIPTNPPPGCNLQQEMEKGQKFDGTAEKETCKAVSCRKCRSARHVRRRENSGRILTVPIHGALARLAPFKLDLDVVDLGKSPCRCLARKGAQ